MHITLITLVVPVSGASHCRFQALLIVGFGIRLRLVKLLGRLGRHLIVDLHFRVGRLGRLSCSRGFRV